jgi:hypothetical protein
MSTSYPANGTTSFQGGNCNGNMVPSGAAAGWCLQQDGYRGPPESTTNEQKKTDHPKRHPRMQTCCTALGNGTVFVQDKCAVWCDVGASDAFDDFASCLKAGDSNGTYTGGLSCSNEDTKLANETSSSGDGDTSGGVSAYNAPKATVLAVLVGVLALSALHL